MARPVNADPVATRKRILDVAAALFAQKGEGNTTMRDIGRAANVGLATVHHYFRTKEDLYRAAVDAMYLELAELRERMFEVVQPDRPFRDVIETVVRGSFRFVCDHRSAVRLLMRTIIDTGELPADRRSGVLLPFLDSGAEILSPALGIPASQMRLVLLSMNHLVVRYSLSNPSELSLLFGGQPNEEDALQQVEEHLVDVALQLCRVKAPPPTTGSDQPFF